MFKSIASCGLLAASEHSAAGLVCAKALFMAVSLSNQLSITPIGKSRGTTSSTLELGISWRTTELLDVVALGTSFFFINPEKCQVLPRIKSAGTKDAPKTPRF